MTREREGLISPNIACLFVGILLPKNTKSFHQRKNMSSAFNTVPYDASLVALASHFCCGNAIIDHFLREPDALNPGYGKTYVWLSDDRKAIIGYYNIGVGYIEQVVDGVRQKIGGSAHINYFALDERFHRKLVHRFDNQRQNVYMADQLLHDCIDRIESIRANHIGFSFITLCSTERGYRLYKRNDFQTLDDDLTFTRDKVEHNCALMYFPLDYE